MRKSENWWEIRGSDESLIGFMKETEATESRGNERRGSKGNRKTRSRQLEGNEKK